MTKLTVLIALVCSLIACSSTTDVAKVEKTAEVQQATLPNIKMWVLSNNWCGAIGYTATHIASSYSGEPDVYFGLPYGWCAGHGLSVRTNGDLVITTSEAWYDEETPDQGAENPEALWVVPENTALAGGELTVGVDGVLYIPMPEEMDYSARSVATLRDGSVSAETIVVGRNGPLMRLTKDQLYGTNGHDYDEAVISPFMEVSAGRGLLSSPFDIQRTLSGNAMVFSSSAGSEVEGMANHSDYDDIRNFFRASSAQVNSSSPTTIEPECWMNGSNFKDTYGFALKSSGIYYTDWDNGAIRWWANSAFTGCNDTTPINPSPTFTITNSDLYSTWGSPALDDDNGLWVPTWSDWLTGATCANGDCGKVLYFSSSTLSSGGSKSPDRVIDMPGWGDWHYEPFVVRFAPGFGNQIR